MLTLDPDSIVVSGHALEQYRKRRKSSKADAGCRRLLARAAQRPVPPVSMSQGRSARLYDVGELRLVMDEHLTTLITIYRINKRSPLSKQRVRGR